MLICGVHFNIVNFHSKLADGSNKVLQVGNIFEFQMYFEVVGAVFEVTFQAGEYRKCTNESNVGNDCNSIETCADAKSENGTCPKSNRGCQAFDLATGTVQNGIHSDNCNRDDACGRKEIESVFCAFQEVEVKQHCNGGCKRNDHKGT